MGEEFNHKGDRNLLSRYGQHTNFALSSWSSPASTSDVAKSKLVEKRPAFPARSSRSDVLPLSTAPSSKIPVSLLPARGTPKLTVGLPEIANRAATN